MGDVFVAEDPGDLTDRCCFTDVGQELVAQALTLRGATHDAGDVDELNCGGQDLGRAEYFGQLAKAIIGHCHHADIWLDRGEGIVRREYVVLGQGVEERRLACIGKSDDADCECHVG